MGVHNTGRVTSRAYWLVLGRRGSAFRVESGGCARGGLVAVCAVVVCLVCVRV